MQSRFLNSEIIQERKRSCDPHDTNSAKCEPQSKREEPMLSKTLQDGLN